MTNISIKSKSNDVQLHMEKAFTIIDTFLPKTYVSKVLEKAPPEMKLYSGLVRNVRNRVPSINLKNHVSTVQLLVEVALENKRNIEKLRESLNN